MKITIEKHRLMVIAEAVKPFIPKNPLFPILDNVLLKCSEDELIFTASDNQNAIEYHLPITEIEISGKKDVCFNILMVSDYVKNIKDENIELYFTDNSVSVSHSSGNIDIAIEPAKDFPNRSIVVPDGLKPINGSELCTALKEAADIADNDRKFESRSNSIHLKTTDKGKLELFSSSTDSYKTFSMVKINSNGFDCRVSIHNTQVSKLINYSYNKPYIDIIALDDRIIAKDSTSIISIMCGEYFAPPYEKVDEQKVVCSINVNKELIINCLDRLWIAIRNTDLTVLCLKSEQNLLTLNTDDTNYGISSKETIEANSVTSNICIAFDFKQIYKLIKLMKSDVITINIFTTAAKVSGKDNNDAFFVTGLVKQ